MSLVAKIFTCKRCGYCCQGETTVSLDADDQKRMILSLKSSEKNVREKYWRVTGNIVQMKTVAGHCIFYDNGCTVHEGRPWRCGQWPLHPSILSDENNFKTIADSCPGIKKEIGYQEFCRILSVLMEKDKVVC
ncbi:MAG: YkgJ family cysteine cluster protein [Desulfobulbaceae bacterium]|nr:YkgJ family cysteine cluster protein [Desulfobulbaceae bacterium]